MTADTGATPRKPDLVLAALTGLAVASVLATAFFWIAWAPTGPDDKQVAEWRQRSLAACRAHPDLLAHLGIATVPYDYLALQAPQFRFTIRADGRAELHVTDPVEQRGDFTMRIAPKDFARLATLAATLRFEQRGDRVPLQPDMQGVTELEAGKDARIAFVANATSVPGEFPDLTRCVSSLESDGAWVREESGDVIIVD
jgi:hypothetical protein